MGGAPPPPPSFRGGGEGGLEKRQQVEIWDFIKMIWSDLNWFSPIKIRFSLI